MSLPGLAVVARAQNMRLEIVDAMTVDRRIGVARRARGQIDRRNLGPLRQAPSASRSLQCAPPSRVSWIRPSSVPTQISPARSGDGRSPRCCHSRRPSRRRSPTSPSQFFASARLPVRSPLIAVQCVPPILRAEQHLRAQIKRRRAGARRHERRHPEI